MSGTVSPKLSRLGSFSDTMMPLGSHNPLLASLQCSLKDVKQPEPRPQVRRAAKDLNQVVLRSRAARSSLGLYLFGNCSLERSCADCELDLLRFSAFCLFFSKAFIHDTSHGGGDRIPQKADEEALRPVI